MKAFFLRTEYFSPSSAIAGGSLAVTQGFSTGMLSLGHQVVVAANRKLHLPDDAAFYEIPYPQWSKNFPEILFLPYNHISFRESRKIIAREQPHFLYQRHSSFNYAGASLKRELGIPFILYAEGSEVWVKKNWGKVYFPKPLEWAEAIQFENADAIVAVSSVLKEQLLGLGVPERKIAVIQPGVDAEKYQPALSGGDLRRKMNLEKKFIVGYVGTFGQWHGVTVLAKSIHETVQQNSNIHFVFVGDGVMRGEVESIISRDNVQAYATMTGSVPSSLAPQWLALCDALVLSAVNNPDVPFFPTPTKLFEYMAMQKPVIASRVGQIPDIIRDQENGLLVEENNPAALAEKILTLSRDSDLQKRLGEAARRDAVERYSWQTHAKQVIAVYEKIMHRVK